MKSKLFLALVILGFIHFCNAEEIKVNWQIVSIDTGGGKTQKAFSAKTLLPNGAKVKVKVVEIKKDSYIYFMDPYPTNGLPKLNSLTSIGDRVNCSIDKEGKLTLVSPLANALEVEGNRLSFNSGLVIDVVVDD